MPTPRGHLVEIRPDGTALATDGEGGVRQYHLRIRNGAVRAFPARELGTPIDQDDAMDFYRSDVDQPDE